MADVAQHAIVVPDAHLLFSGDYRRAGTDLVLSKDGHDHVVHDYFKGHSRATLASPDGAHLSGDLVTALTGEVQVAQAAGGGTPAKIIGQVTKLTGSATAIRNGVSIQLNVGDNVNKGDVVQAGADSSLGLTFIDGTVFGLSANARMVLNEMVYDPNGSSNSSLLSLVQGTITFVAGETAKHGDMKVDTPVATMGIRGTAVLVEIDFAVPGTGSAPPVKFQVLVEPGGRTGSYVLYSKSDPNVVIGTVNQAGQVTSVTGLGDTTTTTFATPLTPIAQAIIQQTLQQYFPSYVPSVNPQSNPSGGSGSTPPTPPDNHLEKLPSAPPQQPALIPINFPGNATAPPVTINVTVTPQNPPPVLTQATVAVAEGGTVVLSAANFLVTDNATSSFTFIVSDVTHGSFQTSADGINWIKVSSFTSAELSAGHVRFAHDGGESAPTFTVTVDDGIGVNHLGNALGGTVEFSNVNNAPTIAFASLAIIEGGVSVLSAANFAVTDRDSGSFTFIVSSVTHGAFQTTIDGVNWVNISSFTSAELNAGHVRFVHDGSELAPTFSVSVDDGASVNHLGNTVAGSVQFTNVNNAPVVTTASFAVVEGGTVLLAAANFVVVDPDSNSFTFNVSGVSHGNFQSTADGINWVNISSFTSAELNAEHVRFVHDGSELAPTFSISVDDGASANDVGNTIAGSIQFTNVNNAPVVTTASFAVVEGGTVLLSSANFAVVDPDSSSFKFSVSNVSHGNFQHTLDGLHWSNITSFTSSELNAGYVRFVHDGSEVAPTFSISVDDGASVNHLGNTIAGSIQFTNVNNAPVVTTASFAVIEGGTVLLSSANFAVVDPDSSSFKFSVSNVSHGNFQHTLDGLHWSDITSFTSSELNSGHVRFVHDGSELAPTFSVSVDDGASVNHLGNTVAGLIQYTNVNDAPTVSAPLTIGTNEGARAFSANLLAGATDRDSGDTATLSVSHVTYKIDSSAVSSSPPAGISVSGGTMNVDPTNAAFDHLAAGETSTIVVSYNVSDIHGATVAQTETVTVAGVNDAPALASGTIATGSIEISTTETPVAGITPGAAAILAAGPGLISGLDEPGYGHLALPPGDDNSSGPIDITSVFGSTGVNFFGHDYTSLYINNNGNITFGSAFDAYTPTAINAGFNNPIIAAFWADVDTRGGGAVYYDLDSVDGVMTITWDHVGYFDTHSNVHNSFQLVLVNEGGGNFDIVYRYGDIQWTNGDLSVNAPARVGYSAGNGIDYFELPQSGNSSALLQLPTAPGNTGVAGVNTVQVHDVETGPLVVTTNGVINFTDPDFSDTHTASVTSADGTIGGLTLSLVHDTTGSGVGGEFQWTYNANAVDVQNAVNHSIDGTAVQNFSVAINDGHGGTINQTVSVTLSAPAENAQPEVTTQEVATEGFRFSAVSNQAPPDDSQPIQQFSNDIFASPTVPASVDITPSLSQGVVDTLISPEHDLASHSGLATNFVLGDFVVHAGGVHAGA